MSPLKGPANRALLGILLALCCFFIFNVSDVIAKYMTHRVSILQLTWAQFAMAPLIVLIVAPGRRLIPVLATRQPWLQLGRTLVELCGVFMFLTALRYMPLANAVAIGFISPFLITILARVLLREAVAPARWLACAAGFAGALIIVRPGLGVTGWEAALPAGSAFCYSLFVIATRHLGRTEQPLTTFFYYGVVGTAVTGVLLPVDWVTPTPIDWLALTAIALTAATSHFLLIRAYSLAPASLIAPFTYASIIGATALGFVVFGDFPDEWTWLGAAVIVVAGLSVYRLEARRAQADAG